MLTHHYKTKESLDLLNDLNALSKEETMEIVIQYWESYYLESGGDNFDPSDIESSMALSNRIKRTSIYRLSNMIRGTLLRKEEQKKNRNFKIDQILDEDDI
jgi:hypothetical protein